MPNMKFNSSYHTFLPLQSGRLRYIPETFCPKQGLLLSGKEGILRED
jgi:hypothetical protein